MNFVGLFVLFILIVSQINAHPLLAAISAVAGLASVANYGVKISKFLRSEDNFNIVWGSECENIQLNPNVYTEICAGPSFRLYVSENQKHLVDIYAYKMIQLAKGEHIECVSVRPHNPGALPPVHQNVNFCAGGRSWTTSLGSWKAGTLRVFESYAQWAHECYYHSCTQARYDELSYKMGKRLLN